MNLVCKPLLEGIMAYWDEVQRAASYTVTLYINEKVIARKTVERGTMYCAFRDLAADLSYHIRVSAEDRNANIIAVSDTVSASGLRSQMMSLCQLKAAAAGAAVLSGRKAAFLT